MDIKDEIKNIIRKDNNIFYILESDLNNLNLSNEERKRIEEVLTKNNIKIFVNNVEMRSPRVKDLTYGDLKGIDYQAQDEPRYSEIVYENGEKVFEDYSELDHIIETELIPNALHIVKKGNKGIPIHCIQLNEITKMKLNEDEIEHVISYLKEMDIAVRGISHDLDEIDNYTSISTYHYSNLPKSLSNEENLELIKKYKETSDNNVLEKIIEGNMRLVVFAASLVYKTNKFIEFDDLVSSGYENLIRVINNFDCEMGNTFSTYAIPCLKGYMLREIYNNYQYPGWVQKYIIKYITVKESLEKEMQNVTIGDIAMVLELPVVRVKELQTLYNSNYNKEVYANNMITNTDTVEKTLMFNALRNSLMDVLSTLKEQEQIVIKLRFGLEDGKTETLESVANTLGFNRERIRQIEAKALRKLRHLSRLNKIKDYRDFDYFDSYKVIDGISEDDMDDYDYSDEFIDSKDNKGRNSL